MSQTKIKKQLAVLLMVSMLTNVGTVTVGAMGIETTTRVEKTQPINEQAENKSGPGDTFLQKVKVDTSSVKKGHIYVPKGVKIQLELVDPINSQKSKKGNTFRLKVVENLLINDVVVIAKDTLVTGVITEARKNGLFGRKGKLEFNIPEVETVNGVRIPLYGVVESKGKSDGGAVAVVALVSIVGGMFMKGTNVYYEPGQLFEATVKEDTDLQTTSEHLAEVMNPDRPHGQHLVVVAK